MQKIKAHLGLMNYMNSTRLLCFYIYFYDYLVYFTLLRVIIYWLEYKTTSVKSIKYFISFKNHQQLKVCLFEMGKGVVLLNFPSWSWT